MAAIDDLKNMIDKLSFLLDSDAYMEMLNDPNTSTKDKTLLSGAFAQRNQLVQQLLSLYAQQIDDRTPQFTALIDKVNDTTHAASAALSLLNTYTNRVASAVQMASFLDSTLKYAMGLGA